MIISSHFSDIRNVIVQDIKNAQKSIYIAVAWFTNHEIYDALLRKIRQGVDVRVIILNDDINLREQSLNFQKLIDLGGKFWLASAEHPMHHKFCIVDDVILITGSYNYTYLADSINHENIVRFQGVTDIIEQFKDEFTSLTNDDSVSNVSEHIQVNPPKNNYYSFKNFRINDINQYALELSQKGQINRANTIIAKIEKSSLAENSNLEEFEITDVVYTHWQKDYYADKITVTNTEIIIRFRTEHSSDGCWIQGVGVPCSWVIEDTESKETIPASCINNVFINGRLLVKEIKPNTVYSFGSESVPEELQLIKIGDNLYKDSTGKRIHRTEIKIEAKGSMTIDVHFPLKKNWRNKTINFLEGVSTRENINYWHCLGINLNLNRCKIH